MVMPLPLICFVFPYRSVGGVSMLFLRMASYLSAQGLARTCVVDYADGFMAVNRDVELCPLLEYRDDRPVTIPEEAIAVFQSMTPWSLFPKLQIHDSTRVFFWNCHPFNLIPLMPGSRELMQNNEMLGRVMLNTVLLPYKLTMRRFVRTLLAHRALVFMDLENRRVTARYLGFDKLPNDCLPIPVDTRTAGVARRELTCDLVDEGIRVLWLGRVVDFKFHILHRALERMNDAQAVLGVPVEVTIIGTGDCIALLQSAAGALTNIRVQFLEALSPSQIDSYMQDNADLVIAMGTSALDAGRLGIPTLLLDYSYKPVDRCYRFTWLHERDGYTLADQINASHLSPTDASMLQKLQELINTRESLSRQVQAYVSANHSLDVVAAHLLEHLKSSDCQWQHLRAARVLGRGFLYRLFARLRNFVSYNS
jgi:glycosyltransferase involved in cell wall biosynthesis